jgi:hypothetical protein
MELHIFGAATPAGEALRRLCMSSSSDWNILCYTRFPANRREWFWPVDLSNPAVFPIAGESGRSMIWISFAPIWLFAPFFEWLTVNRPDQLRGLCGLIVCSSTSALTKRFSANRSDRLLVARLTNAEDQLIASSARLMISCRILRPTIIYGQVGCYGDRNLSRLLRLMRRFPLIPLPAETGLRQPIHASQLAAVAQCLVQKMADSSASLPMAVRISVGGDIQLSYLAMLQALQSSLPPGDPARRCRLLPIPSRLFFLLAAPLLLRSPKLFEAVLRIAADLNGFTPAHQLLAEQPQPFPVIPLAL